MSHDWPVKHKVLLFILLVFAIFPANAQTTVAQYKACLEKHGEDPVEYIFRLFEKADVVILANAIIATSRNTISSRAYWQTSAFPNESVTFTQRWDAPTRQNLPTN